MQQVLNRKIDNIIKRVNHFKIDSNFNREYRPRLKKTPPKTLREDELLKVFVKLIAFSQQAQSARVKKLIKEKVFDKIFENYSVDKVSKINPCDLAEKHWENITAIRQRTKLFQIVMFARLIKKDKTLLSLLTNPPIPKSLKSLEDIDEFWTGFKILQSNLKDAKAPFLRETTTLLHFLLDMGYDCIKPDSAVMKASVDIGIVDKATRETNLIQTVKFIQEYSIKYKVRPPVIDLYLIIHGRQTEASSLVDKDYYKRK